MDISKIIETMTPDVYSNLKSAVELGKWPDGSRLTEKQLESSIQAVMLYDSQHNTDNKEPFRVQQDGSVVLGKPQATQEFNRPTQNSNNKKLSEIHSKDTNSIDIKIQP